MKEFVSIKVSSFDHAALATSLTTKAAEGWDVVSVVAVGNDIVAYLSRETPTRPSSTGAPTASTATTATSASSGEPAGWGASRTADTASAPTQVVATTASADVSPTASSTTPSVPADWYKDPSGRYEYRYWDGTKWTEHVSRAGTVHKDPPTP